LCHFNPRFFGQSTICRPMHVCYEDGNKGFVLACDHCMCIRCTGELLSRAIQDSSLLPLRCCEIPIDLSMSRHILPAADSKKLTGVAERVKVHSLLICFVEYLTLMVWVWISAKN
jgi:hypothetical protein